MGWEELSRKQVGTGAEERGRWGAAVTAGWLQQPDFVCGQVLGRRAPHLQNLSEEQMVVAGLVGQLQQRRAQQAMVLKSGFLSVSRKEEGEGF